MKYRRSAEQCALACAIWGFATCAAGCGCGQGSRPFKPDISITTDAISIAFTFKEPSGRTGLAVGPLAGGPSKTVCEFEWVDGIACASDSEVVLSCVPVGSTGDPALYEIGLSDGSAKLLLAPPKASGYRCPALQGNRILFMRDWGARPYLMGGEVPAWYTLCTARLDGSRLDALSAPSRDFIGLGPGCWRGTKAVYTEFSTLYEIDMETRHKRRLATANGLGTVSPSGRLVAYQGDDFEIHVFDRRRNADKVVSGPGDVSNLLFGKSDSILYVSTGARGESTPSLWTIHLATGKCQYVMDLTVP